MEQRYAGRSGLRVSDIGLGTMTWGRETDADAAAAQYGAFRDAGGTLVDTAVSYSGGRAESILGGLLAGDRESMIVATKAGVDRRGVGEDAVRTVDASRGALLSRLDNSLRRMGLDHIDLWQVHTVDANVSSEETLGALDHAVASGKVRYVGVSNYPGWRLAQAVSWQAADPRRAPIVAAQVEYSLLARGVEREVVPAALSLGVGLICYSPLGGGVLTGKYRDAVPAGSRGAAATGGPRHAEPRAVGIVEAVATAAEGLATSPLAVALSWVRGRPGVASAVVGARTASQLNTILAARSVRMPDAIRHALDEVSAPVLGYPEDVG